MDEEGPSEGNDEAAVALILLGHINFPGETNKVRGEAPTNVNTELSPAGHEDFCTEKHPDKVIGLDVISSTDHKGIHKGTC